MKAPPGSLLIRGARSRPGGAVAPAISPGAASFVEQQNFQQV
jgi:hypothetical protein